MRRGQTYTFWGAFPKLHFSLHVNFCQTISYKEVCLFSIIKNIVNIYINCTTYIQIHTVLYSKVFLLQCYPVAPCIASWTNYLPTSTMWYWQHKGVKWHSLMVHSTTGQILQRFGLYPGEMVITVCPVQCARHQMRVVGWRRATSSPLASHSFDEDDDS